jgi:hypothetical protein
VTNQTPSWQFTFILGLAIAIFGGGAMYLLATGKEVPGALWGILGGLANAIVAHNAFFTQRVMNQQGLGHVMGAIDALKPAATTTTITSPTPGSVTTETKLDGNG